MSELQSIEKKSRTPLNRNFKLLVLNASISRTGTSAFQLAILWIALLLTKSPVLAGLADGMSALPLMLSFIFGAFVDRLMSKKALAISISILRVLTIFVLFVALTYKNLLVETLSIYLVAFVIGMSMDILNSIRASWSKQFMDESQYQVGTSLSQSVSAIAAAAGSAVSGLLLLLGLQYAVYSFAVIFAVSILPLFMIKGEQTVNIATEENIRSSVKEGFRFIFGDKRLRALVILIMAINLTVGTVGIFFVYLVEVNFKLTAIYYTSLALSITLGLIVGSILGSKAKGRVGTYSVGTIFTTALLLISIGYMNNIFPDYAISAAIGILVGVLNVVINTSTIRIVDHEMMARASGTFSTFGISITFISGAIGGALIQLLTLRGAFILIGVILGVVSFIPLLFREFYDLRVESTGADAVTTT